MVPMVQKCPWYEMHWEWLEMGKPLLVATALCLLMMGYFTCQEVEEWKRWSSMGGFCSMESC